MPGYRSAPPSTRLPCPVCRTALVDLAVGEGRGGGCQSCAGVWVDETGLGAVRERLFATILEHAAPRTAPPRASSALPCPLCAKTMTVTEVGGAEVDICPGHGTWFDAGELEMLAHSIAVSKNRAALGDAEDVPRSVDERGGSSNVQATVESLNAQLSRSIDRVEQLVEMQRLREEMLRYRFRD